MTSATSGLSTGSNWQMRSIVADPVDPDVFFAFSVGSVASGHGGLWKSTDRGQNFTRIHTSLTGFAYPFWTKMYGVPGNEGHLFMVLQTSNTWTEGLQASFSGFVVHRTQDGGDTIDVWDSNIQMLDCLGFGKALTPGGYPTIYFSGYYHGSYGLYRVTDNDVTTIRRYWDPYWGRWPNGIYGGNGRIISLTGDPDIFGRVYVCFGGHGFAYADLV
jgi:xyloglucan-specific exo-beta-1,4-glucanase